MPPLPAASKVVSLAVMGTFLNGGRWLSRVYVQYTGTAPTNADLAAFLTSVDTALNTNLKPLMNADVNATELHAIDLTSSTSAVADKVIARTGTRAGTAIPADAASVISYEIARRYRGGHPRGYWPFGSVTDLATPRIWGAAAVAAFKSGYDAWMTAVLAAGWTGAGTLTQVNVSYFHGFTVVTNPITGRARNVPTLRVAPTIDAVTSTIARTSFGTQRRRIEYSG